MQDEGFYLLQSTRITKTTAMNHPQVLMRGGSYQYTQAGQKHLH